MGTVHRITDKGDVRVQFDGCSNRWTFYSGSLTKVLNVLMLDFMLPHTTVTHLQFLCEASAQKGLCHANYLSVIICVGDVFRGGSICKSHE